MQRAQAQDLGLAGAVWGAGVVEIHAFGALEEPAHGRPGGGLAHLVGHGLGGRGQALAHPQLGQLIDQPTFRSLCRAGLGKISCAMSALLEFPSQTGEVESLTSRTLADLAGKP